MLEDFELASASTSQTQQAPSEGLVSRITSAPIPTSTSSGRQILPGPNRAGLLMGAKYTASSSSTTTTTSTVNGASQNGTGMGGFERISEQEPFDDAGDLAGVLDFYGPEETDIGAFLSSILSTCSLNVSYDLNLYRRTAPTPARPVK
jgi:hypothetical protein